MITRNGVALMNARTQNVSIAKETLEIIKNKNYTTPSGNVVDISGMLDTALQGTVLYKAGADLPDTDWGDSTIPTTEVLNETTSNAAVRLLAAGKTDLVALNFASARNVGGGFLAGALAQEEDLCRASALYVCTKSKPVFYKGNILSDGTFYTDNVIYSPKVPFFRDSYHNLLEAPFKLSIISSPAPNLSSLTGRIEGLEAKTKGILRERAIRILDVAARHGHKNIILGAWGCGAFGNDPKMVAEVFKLALEKVPAFRHVCFATYDDRDPPVVFQIFKETFNQG